MLLRLPLIDTEGDERRNIDEEKPERHEKYRIRFKRCEL
jgi:hypothetical protein